MNAHQPDDDPKVVFKYATNGKEVEIDPNILKSLPKKSKQFNKQPVISRHHIATVLSNHHQ